MRHKISINSLSDGKFELITINNRPHIKTTMVSVEADSVMNGLFYPFDQVVNSFNQLSNLPMPAGHPKVDGEHISAFHPLAMNAHNIGGFALNSRMEGNLVKNDLAIDLDVANKDERGIEIVRRIKEGERIPVSTGLNADRDDKPGIHNGKEYQASLSNMDWNHIAFLLNEKQAGDNTFINEDVLICNLAESVDELQEKVHIAVRARFGDDSWPSEILLNPERVIVRKGELLISIAFGYNEAGDVVFTGEEIPVERKVSFEPLASSSTHTNQRASDMDQKTLVTCLIANKGNNLTEADTDRLMSMSESGLAAVMSNSEPVTIESATKVIETAGLCVNNVTAEQAAEFATNADGFKEYQESLASARSDLIEKIVNAKGSNLTKDELGEMNPGMLQKLANSFVPVQNYSMNGGQTTHANSDSKFEHHKGV